MPTPISALATLGFVALESICLDGQNFTWWVQKMKLFWKQLKLFYVLTGCCQEFLPGATTAEINEATSK